MAVTEDGKGHISYNEICGMEWAGIDIRNGADPVVSHNKIRKGQADGIVIGEGGKGILYDNDIQGIVKIAFILNIVHLHQFVVVFASLIHIHELHCLRIYILTVQSLKC